MPALYDVSIPAFIRGLKNLSVMLEKGKIYAAEQGMGLSELLDARLIDDMATVMLAEFDAEARFKLRSARGAGRADRGLELLRKAADPKAGGLPGS